MKILAIGAHPDDLEYGCFGTLKKYKQQGYKIHYLMLTCGGDSGDAEVRMMEQKEAGDLLGANVYFTNLQSAFLSNDSGRATIKAIEEAIRLVQPRIIFSHTDHDTHQDHRLVNQATVSATRFFQGKVYFFEGYSSLRSFQPTVFVGIEEFFDDKLRALGLFTTQAKKFYMNPKVLESIAVFRGAQHGLLQKSEAFEVGRITL